MRIEFHPEAAQELSASAGWYLERSEVAAKRFGHAVELALDKIAQQPDRFPQIDSLCRACNLAVFPFQIVYRVVSDRVFVIAVAHLKRRPGYWRLRTSGTP